jgi:TRAP-type mannitol/chloroaromatic compound transport system permease small subunit
VQEPADRPDLVHMPSISREADEIARAIPESFREGGGAAGSLAAPALRIFALSMVALSILFLINTYLSIWRGWPGVPTLFGHLGWFGVDAPLKPLAIGAVTLGWVQLGLYATTLAAVVAFVFRTPHRPLQEDAEVLFALTGYIIRWAFFSVLLIGLADLVVSFLRVEGTLQYVLGADIAQKMGRPSFRGEVVHLPLMAVSLVIAKYARTLGFTWLALLIVAAEVQIVIARFVFSYEQAFMGDLVRFWYGALFLFASPYTLINEGHVRVDILYANYSQRGKAWTNVLGSVFLGLPLCWIILTRGMWGRANVITGPLLSYEVTQSGYGLYVKYLLAGFLLIFAFCMLIQFMGYLLKNAAVLLREPDKTSAPGTNIADQAAG